MLKLQDKPLEFKGEITVFLSLIFILLLSMTGAMIEVTSISLTKSMNQADLTLAMESLFAEYEPVLLKNYGILVKEGRELYNIENRLSYYGAGGLKHEIVQMELLSDQQGQEFYRQAVTYMGGKVGQCNPSIENPYQEQAEHVKEQFQNLMKNESAKAVSELQNMTSTFLLANVLPEGETVSNKSVDLSILPSKRELAVGVGESIEVEKSFSGKWLFASYLTEHFLDYTKTDKTNPLSYETEYLLAGKASDAKNLEWVLKKLLSIRIAVNYGFLLFDEAKLAEAEGIALSISTLLFMPEAKEVIKQAFLFYWAYGESKEDLQNLLLGKRVPLGGNEGSEENGAAYEDYLKALLAAEKTEVLCMRALDLLELNAGIQVDNCVTALELKSIGYTQRQLRYLCNAKFEYQ